MSQKKNKKIYIVVPVYNESTVIGSVIDDLKKHGYKNIIVIDDGSKDQTYTVLQKKNVILLSHNINLGQGAAIGTGFKAAEHLQADIVVSFDGDGQHAPSDIKKLIKIIDQGYDVALGTRIYSVKQMPLTNIVYNHLANFLTRLIFGVQMTDSQSGLRAYSQKALKTIQSNAKGYEYASEILRDIVKYNLSFKETPIQVIYTEYSVSKKQRQGIINGIKTAYKMILSA